MRLFGLGIIIHETVLRDIDRPYLLGAALVMMAGVDALEAWLESRR